MTLHICSTRNTRLPLGCATGFHHFTALTYQWIKIWWVTQRRPSATRSILLNSYFIVVPMLANNSWCAYISDSGGQHSIHLQIFFGGVEGLQDAFFCNHPIHYLGHERWWRHQSRDGGGTSSAPVRERSLWHIAIILSFNFTYSSNSKLIFWTGWKDEERKKRR